MLDTRVVQRGERRACRGFSLIELLVVIGIVSLLVAIVLPVLGAAREAGRHAQVLSGLRQTMIGYSVYQNDFEGHVMWGHLPLVASGSPVMVDGKPLSVLINGTGDPTLDGTRQFYYEFLVQRWPWRLHPYFGEVWEVVNYHLDELPKGPGAAYLLSVEPSIGINATYVGGYTTQGDGFTIDNASTPKNVIPNRGAHVVFREQEVLRPSQLLTFGEVQSWQPGFNQTDEGLPFLSPPRMEGLQWLAGADEILPQGIYAGRILGAPIGRYASGTATAFFDGHAETLTLKELEDMRYWANYAETPDYTY